MTCSDGRYPLQEYSTDHLIAELVKRKGVCEYAVNPNEPYFKIEGSSFGPARILVIYPAEQIFAPKDSKNYNKGQFLGDHRSKFPVGEDGKYIDLRKKEP